MLVAYFENILAFFPPYTYTADANMFMIPGQPELYNDSPHPDNPLSCIHANPLWRHTYYSSMSNAYARMARESATVMHKTQDYDNPPMNGIWGKTELPALRDKTDVKEVSSFSAPITPSIACFSCGLTSDVTDDEDQRRQLVDYQVAVAE
jgi:hypothetical protein